MTTPPKKTWTQWPPGKARPLQCRQTTPASVRGPPENPAPRHRRPVCPLALGHGVGHAIVLLRRALAASGAIGKGCCSIWRPGAFTCSGWCCTRRTSSDLTVLLIVCALALFLFTTVAGRLWCGFSCPQTVYTEIFMWLERRHRRRPQRPPAPGRQRLDAGENGPNAAASTAAGCCCRCGRALPLSATSCPSALWRWK